MADDDIVQRFRTDYSPAERANLDRFREDAVRAATEPASAFEKLTTSMQRTRRSFDTGGGLLTPPREQMEGLTRSVNDFRPQFARGMEEATRGAGSFTDSLAIMSAKFLLVRHGVGAVVGAITGAATALGDFAVRGNRVNDLMDNLTIDIGAAREQLGGLVSNTDLARFANEVFLRGLDLTDKEFAAVANAAGLLSDKLGTDVTGELNRVADAVSLANPRLLKQMGITVDWTKALDAAAEAMGKTRQELSAEEEQRARQTIVKERLVELMERERFHVSGLGDAYEQLKVTTATTVTEAARTVDTTGGKIIGFFTEGRAALDAWTFDWAAWAVSGERAVQQIAAAFDTEREAFKAAGAPFRGAMKAETTGMRAPEDITKKIDAEAKQRAAAEAVVARKRRADALAWQRETDDMMLGIAMAAELRKRDTVVAVNDSIDEDRRDTARANADKLAALRQFGIDQEVAQYEARRAALKSIDEQRQDERIRAAIIEQNKIDELGRAGAEIALRVQQTVAAAVGQTLQAVLTGEKTFAGAMKKLPVLLMNQLTTMAIGKSIALVAYGLEQLSGFPTGVPNPALASAAFAAAAKWGAVGVTAGVIGRVAAGALGGEGPGAGGKTKEPAGGRVGTPETAAGFSTTAGAPSTTYIFNISGVVAGNYGSLARTITSALAEGGARTQRMGAHEVLVVK